MILLALVALSQCCEASWVDPDTPIHQQHTKAMTHGDDRRYELVGCFPMMDDDDDDDPTC